MTTYHYERISCSTGTTPVRTVEKQAWKQSWEVRECYLTRTRFRTQVPQLTPRKSVLERHRWWERKGCSIRGAGNLGRWRTDRPSSLSRRSWGAFTGKARGKGGGLWAGEAGGWSPLDRTPNRLAGIMAAVFECGQALCPGIVWSFSPGDQGSANLKASPFCSRPRGLCQQARSAEAGGKLSFRRSLRWYGSSVLSLQFSSKPKTAVRNKAF